MLTPARKANSRSRGSPGTSGSIAWPSLRVAQAPAKSFELMMMEETPSPARAGRLLTSALVAGARRALALVGLLVGGRQRLDPELTRVEATGEVLQQEERFG